jgi:hypothetical protein
VGCDASNLIDPMVTRVNPGDKFLACWPSLVESRLRRTTLADQRIACFGACSDGIIAFKLWSVKLIWNG